MLFLNAANPFISRKLFALSRRMTIEDRIHIYDLHATVLKLLGLDHTKLTFLFQGRQQRLTDVGGDNEFAARLLS